jgi:hypothetical protein
MIKQKYKLSKQCLLWSPSKNQLDRFDADPIRLLSENEIISLEESLIDQNMSRIVTENNEVGFVYTPLLIPMG